MPTSERSEAPSDTGGYHGYLREAFELLYGLVFAAFAWGGLGITWTGVVLIAWSVVAGGPVHRVVWGILALGIVMLAIGTAMVFGAERLEIGTEVEVQP